MASSYSAYTSTHAPSSVATPSSISNRRHNREVSSLGDPSLVVTEDCYTSSSLSSCEGSRRGVRESSRARAPITRAAPTTTAMKRITNGGAAPLPSRTKSNRPSGSGGGTVFDLRDLRLTSRDTDQQTLIWNEMAANRRKLEEENQVLRDKLAEAQVANKVLRVKIKQKGGGGGGGGVTNGRGLGQGSRRSGGSEGDTRGTVEPARVRIGETGRGTTGLLQKVFSRKDSAFRNPVAPGIKRFKVSTPALTSLAVPPPRGLPLPPPTKHVQHVLPLPDRDPNVPLVPLAYYVTHKSSGRSTRTPPAEIVVPSASSSPETVPESKSSIVSPSNSPSSSATSSPPSLRQQIHPPRPPQQQQSRGGNHRHSLYHQQRQQQEQEAHAYSLMRVVPLRRQETTESTATVPHANHSSNNNNNQSRSRKKQPMSPGSIPELPILMEDPGYEIDDDMVSGCQPSSTMMMITTSDFPTSILERLAGARIGPSPHDPDHGQYGTTTAAHGPASAIVLSACTPLWYDEPEHNYVHSPSRGLRREPTKYSTSTHEHY